MWRNIPYHSAVSAGEAPSRKTRLCFDWYVDAAADLANKNGGEHSCELCRSESRSVTDILPILARDISDRNKQVLVYVAGYLVFKYCRCEGDSDDTAFEFDAHGAYLTALNRGGLCVPRDCAVTFTYFSYVSFLCLQPAESMPPCFVALLRSLLEINAYFDLLQNDTEAMRMCRALCNIMLNNFTSKIPRVTAKEPAIKLAKLSQKTQ